MSDEDIKKGYALLQEKIDTLTKENAELRELVQLHVVRYDLATSFMADVFKKLGR